MRTGASDVPSRGPRGQARLDARLKKARQAKFLQGVLESLETRALMAVLPAPQVAGLVQAASASSGNVSSPTVVVDRYNPNHLVSVWVRNDPTQTDARSVTIVEGAYSNNGGATWNNMGSSIAGSVKSDAAIAPGPGVDRRYAQTINPRVAFDNAGNFYVLTQQTNGGNTSGALVLKKFDFNGATPTTTYDRIVRQYVSDPVINPTLTVDDNKANVAGQLDPYAGNVWIGWTTNESVPTGDLFARPGSSWNANSVQVIASSDGGLTFSGATKANVDSTFDGPGNAWGRWTGSGGIFANATPKIVTAPGTAANGNRGGQATVVWDNFGRDPNFTTDLIQSNQVTGAYSYGYAGAGGAINQGVNPGSGPYNPQNTSFSVQVTTDPADPAVNKLVIDPTRFIDLSKLTVNMTLQQTDMSWLRATLTLPNGMQVLLFSNAQDANGQTPTGQTRGITGANLGIAGTVTNNNVAVPYGLIGGTFDDSAARSINDRSGAAAGYTSTYRSESADQPVGGFFSLDQINAMGLTAADLQGQWTLTITAYRDNGTNPAPQLLGWGINLTSGADALGTSERVAETLVRGSLSGTYSRASAAAGPQGIGPGISAAQDNTLGNFSLYQGRIYVAYTGYLDIRTAGVINPTDNTDIFYAYSDNGGQSWVNVIDPTTGLLKSVNDDQGSRDGFSGANHDPFQGQIVGRAQFLPQVAVDQSTGSVVFSWRDGRDDSNRSRSSVYLAASVDGGATFSAQSYANPPETATDAITGALQILNPAGDNFATIDPAASAFGFGLQMGLAVGSGQVYAAWAGNWNQSRFDANRNVFGQRFQTYVQRMTIAAGPRVVDSTMGVVGEPGDLVNPATPSGPVANAFDLFFDRPIDPTSFTTDKVHVFFKGTAANAPFVQLPVTGFQQISDTQFRVLFNPGTGNLVGTYSYILDPTVTDRLGAGNRMDQNANGVAGEGALGYTGYTPGDAYVTPKPSNRFMTWGATPQALLVTPFDTETLPLIVPGAHIVDTWVRTGPGDNSLLKDGTTSSLYLRYDRDILASSFEADARDVLQLMGPSGSLMAPQRFASDQVGQSIPAAASTSTPGMLLSKLTVPNYDQTFKSAGLTVTLNISFPNDQMLTVDLIGPDGTTFRLFSGVGSTGANFINTTLDDAAARSITAGTAPFTGSFRPTGAGGLATFNGKNVEGEWTLRVSNSQTGSVGVLNGWSIGVKPLITARAVDAVGGYARTFAIDFPKQSLSGTYTAEIGPNVADRFNQAADANLNAGVDALRGEAPGVATATQTFGSGTVNQPMANQVIASTINVADNFPIQGITSSGRTGIRLQMNFTTTNIRGLSAYLVYHPQVDPAQPNNPLVGLSVINVFNGNQAPAGALDVNVVFDDAAPTPAIQFAPPFYFTPTTPMLSEAGVLGEASSGAWRLVLLSDGTSSATLRDWSLLMEKPQPGTGLGEPVADRSSASYRIFQTDPANPLSRNTWTSVGPAAVVGSAGLVGAMAQDPSDRTGNTFYVAGASGGVWKTTNFLTSDPNGPTYIPLTDFGPSRGLNVGGISVFPRNNDPNQSIIVASTGDGDTGSRGVGFLISKDGGATWNLYDSTNNVDAQGNLLPISSTARDRAFVGATSYKVAIDPSLSLQGEVVIYAALGGTNGGLWRSIDTGKTWQNMKAGTATDVILDPTSAVGGDPTLQIVYGAFQGDGVYLSPNRGQVWNLMAGGVGNPLIVDTYDFQNVGVAAGPTPNGALGRITLGKPAITSSPLYNQIYSGWLYAAVSNADGSFNGLYMTKDFGQNWVQVQLPTEPRLNAFTPAIPSNDIALGDYNVTNGLGGYSISLAVDPTNPNVVYLGGFAAPTTATGMIRVDATNVWDAHNLKLYSSVSAGGQTNYTSLAPVTIGTLAVGWDTQNSSNYLNYIRNPDSPFLANATRFVRNLGQFTNNGFGAKWTPFDAPFDADGLAASYNNLITMVDPISGLPRLIYSGNRGIWTVLDKGGEMLIGEDVGTTPAAGVNRNGNLAIAQYYYGAVQPNSVGLTASVDNALFAGASNDGGQVSFGDVLESGDLVWSQTSGGGNSGGVAFDPQGFGTLYQSFQPGSMPTNLGTTFFRVNHIGRTFNLIQSSGGANTPDPQWGPGPGATFAVNPVSGQQMLISSSTGRIFATETQGITWFQIGDPSVFGSPGGYSKALAYGAPDPAAQGGVGNLGRFMYVGTSAGRVFITRVGGGGAGNAWTEVSTGLDGSQVQRIIPSQTYGSHSAYAVTTTGVYFIRDSTAAGASWVNVTGNLRNLSYSIFGTPYNQNTDPNAVKLSQSLSLSAMVVDWRYSIPNSAGDPAGAGTHPVLYVSGDTGVFRSIDNGVTWSLYPNQALDGSAMEGGMLPRTEVTDLDLSLGAINPATGVANLVGPLDPYSPNPVGDPDLLLASTWGRGMFAIKMAPLTIPGTLRVAASDLGGTTPDGTPIVTTARFTLSGLSMTTGFNNATRITVVDQSNGTVVGGFNIADLSTNVAANWTDAAGNFSIRMNPGAFAANGLKTLRIYATDDAGAVGNPLTLTINLDANDLTPATRPIDPTLGLLAADNTGVVPSQNYTNKPTPRFVGVTSPGATVELQYANASQNFVPFVPPIVATADANGAFTLQFPNVGDGTFIVRAVASNSFGPANNPSPLVVVRIKQQGPTAAPTLTLSPNSDSGIVGDNMTNVRKPVFTGSIGATNAGSIIRIYRSPINQGDPILAQTTADAQGNYSVQLALSLTNGVIPLTATAVDPASNPAPGSSAPVSLTIMTTALDYSGSALDLGGSSALSQSQSMLYLRNDGIGFGQWFTHYTPPSYVPTWFYNGTTLGSAGDIPLAGDFDGDGRNDLATFNQSTAQWVVWRSSQGGLVFNFGDAGASVPVVGNFDGPGVTQYGVYSVVNGTGVWTLTTPSGTVRQFGFGTTGDVPLIGDFLGLGYEQAAVYRPSTGQFLAYTLSTGTYDVVATLPANQIPVPGEYDNLTYFQNGQRYRTTPAVFDPALGVFTIDRPAGSPYPRQVVFQGGDIPVPADYAGVGWDLPAVYRPSTGQVLVKAEQTLPNGANAEVTSFPGAVGAPIVPVGAPLAYRQLSTASLIAGALPNAQRGFGSGNATVTFTGFTQADAAAADTTSTDTAPAAKAEAPSQPVTPAPQAPAAVLPSLALSGANAAGTRQPLFQGTAAPGSSVDLYLSGTGVVGAKRVGTATADVAGRYAFQLPAGARNGSYTLTANAAGTGTPIAAADFQVVPTKLRTPVRGRFAHVNRPRATPAAAQAAPQAAATLAVSVASPTAPQAAPVASSDAFSQAIQSIDDSRLPASRKRRV